jgi:tetratricopeptide (TPR) repeat protein
MPPPPDPERRLWSDFHSGDSGISRFAAHLLSSLLKQRGKRVAAERLLRDNLKAHGSQGAVGTWVRLGRFLEEEGRVNEARRAYDEVLRLASVEETPEAMMDLAAHWARSKEVERARGIYLQIVDRGQGAPIRALAAYRAARIDIGLENPERAIDALRCALQEADPSLEPFVLVDLAELLVKRDGSEEGAELLLRAIAGNHPDQAPRAAFALARLHRKYGDHLEAYRFLQLVIESEHPRYAPGAQEEQDQLIRCELDNLLTQSSGLLTPSSKDGRLTRLAELDSRAYVFILPTFKRDLLETWVECERSWMQADSREAPIVSWLSLESGPDADSSFTRWTGLCRAARHGIERDRARIFSRLYTQDQLAVRPGSMPTDSPRRFAVEGRRNCSVGPFISTEPAVAFARVFELCERLLLSWLAKRLLAEGNLRADGWQDPLRTRLVWPTLLDDELGPDPKCSPLGLDLTGVESDREAPRSASEWLWQSHPPPVGRRRHALAMLMHWVTSSSTSGAGLLTTPLGLPGGKDDDERLLDRRGIEFISATQE